MLTSLYETYVNRPKSTASKKTNPPVNFITINQGSNINSTEELLRCNMKNHLIDKADSLWIG